jgi:hypothetical protein
MANHFNEIAAYRLSRSMGFHLVPVTTEVVLHTPQGDIVGSAQIFVRHSSVNRIETMAPPARMRLFDYIIGNVDRHDQNWRTLSDIPNRSVAIDHGMSFFHPEGFMPNHALSGDGVLIREQFILYREHIADMLTAQHWSDDQIGAVEQNLATIYYQLCALSASEWPSHVDSWIASMNAIPGYREASGNSLINFRTEINNWRRTAMIEQSQNMVPDLHTFRQLIDIRDHFDSHAAQIRGLVSDRQIEEIRHRILVLIDRVTALHPDWARH